MTVVQWALQNSTFFSQRSITYKLNRTAISWPNPNPHQSGNEISKEINDTQMGTDREIIALNIG